MLRPEPCLGARTGWVSQRSKLGETQAPDCHTVSKGCSWHLRTVLTSPAPGKNPARALGTSCPNMGNAAWGLHPNAEIKKKNREMQNIQNSESISGSHT